MKNICLLLLAVTGTVFSGFAQITIQSSDLPKGGDKNVFISTASTKDTVDETLTDTNYTWDFSRLKPAANDTVKFQDPTKIAAIVFFPYFGDVTQRLYGGFFAGNRGIFKNSSSSYSMVALAYTLPVVGTIPLSYSNPDVVYTLPIKYGNSPDSCFFSASFQKYVSIKGKRVNTIDGWGKVTTPFGTFKCIRIKSEVTETDSLGFNIKNQRTEYKWLAKGQKMPVMEVVVTSSILGKQKTIYYLDSARTIRTPFSPKPNFTADKTDVYVGDTVKFTNGTLDPAGLLGYSWSFSPNKASYVDSTKSSSKNPHVIFTDTGKYSVSLSATIPFFNLKGDTTRIDYIIVHAVSKPAADFYADRLHPTTANIVNLTDNSTGHPTQWTWIITPNTVSWMNGTNSNSQNPQLRFDSVGKYTITLVAANTAGSGTATKTNYITVSSSGIEEYSPYSNLIEAYPNPCSGICHISTAGLQNDKLHGYEIKDPAGRIMFSVQNINLLSGFDINIHSFPNGFYLLTFFGNKGNYIKRLIKN